MRQDPISARVLCLAAGTMFDFQDHQLRQVFLSSKNKGKKGCPEQEVRQSPPPSLWDPPWSPHNTPAVSPPWELPPWPPCWPWGWALRTTTRHPPASLWTDGPIGHRQALRAATLPPSSQSWRPGGSGKQCRAPGLSAAAIPASCSAEPVSFWSTTAINVTYRAIMCSSPSLSFAFQLPSDAIQTAQSEKWLFKSSSKSNPCVAKWGKFP